MWSPSGSRYGVRNLLLISGCNFGIFQRMGRPKRADDGGLMYHVINGGQHADEDLRAGRRLRGLRAGSREVVDRTRTRLLAYCVMPNRWHFIVWPQHDGDLSRCVGWLTHTQWSFRATLTSSPPGVCWDFPLREKDRPGLEQEGTEVTKNSRNRLSVRRFLWISRGYAGDRSALKRLSRVLHPVSFVSSCSSVPASPFDMTSMSQTEFRGHDT